MSTPTPSPLLGTAYILSQSPSATGPSPIQQTVITPSLCANLSAFKSVLRQSRTMDDSIILRLNRAHAIARSNPAMKECDSFWSELVERWAERGQVLGFCNDVVDRSAKAEMEAKAKEEKVEMGLNRIKPPVMGRGETPSELKRRMIHSEIRVEEIIRARSIDFFVSRCPSHSQTPPPPPLPSVPDDGFQPRRRFEA
ncbi:hypothetical protein P7C70_g2199, partial [Phenoliferia sp. Uapishka_3]